MFTIDDFETPTKAIEEFEQLLAKFTGAPYVVATDCCTHALELCFRYKKIEHDVILPHRTYLSVPMLMHKLNIPYSYKEIHWFNDHEYQIGSTNIWDSARLLKKNMYRKGQFQCLSFGVSKPITLLRGGAILTDNIDAYVWLKRACYDGRDLSYIPWQTQENFNVGYHYMMRAEEAISGINKLINKDFVKQIKKFYNYPDLRTITINY